MNVEPKDTRYAMLHDQYNMPGKNGTQLRRGFVRWWPSFLSLLEP